MGRVAARAAAVLIVVLAVGAVLGVCLARAGAYMPSDETRIQALLNATRTGKGLAALRRNDRLVGMARRQADRMAAKGSIYHNLDLGAEMTSSGLDWQKAGENVGVGPDADVVEQAFLDSPHHYENIVDRRYDTVGIGVVDGADGRRYVVQVFADLRGAEIPAPPAPKPVTTTAEPQRQPAARLAPASPTRRPEAAAPSAAPVKAAPQARSAHPIVIIGGVVRPLDLGL